MTITSLQGYRLALEDIIAWCQDKFSKPVNIADDVELRNIVRSCLGTKMFAPTSIDAP